MRRRRIAATALLLISLALTACGSGGALTDLGAGQAVSPTPSTSQPETVRYFHLGGDATDCIDGADCWPQDDDGLFTRASENRWHTTIIDIDGLGRVEMSGNLMFAERRGSTVESVTVYPAQTELPMDQAIDRVLATLDANGIRVPPDAAATIGQWPEKLGGDGHDQVGAVWRTDFGLVIVEVKQQYVAPERRATTQPTYIPLVTVGDPAYADRRLSD